MGLRRTLNRVLGPLGYRVVRARELELLYRHDYAGGYEEYRRAQITRNRESLVEVERRDRAWASPETLTVVVDDLEAHGLGNSGICHGARNGFEVKWLRDRLGGDIIGTDISDTATRFPNMVVWDFHDEKPEWRGRFDFVYTNALDHAFDPSRALRTWAAQVKPHGRIYVEHSEAHTPKAANEFDPFGAHPFIMPYLFHQWGRGHFQLVRILEPERTERGGAQWMFVLTPVDQPIL